MPSVFTLSPEEYKRDLSIIPTAISDSAYFIHKQTGRSMEECLEFVNRQTSPEGKFPLKDPEVLALSKEKPGTRTAITMPFSKYIQDAVDRKDMISPTMATYVSPDVHESLLSQYIFGNIAARAKDKKEGIEAGMMGDKTTAAFKEIQQTSRKIKNNALSGAHASQSTPLYNKSSHSTLTSTCRTITSAGNGCNEKFIMGNRHYWAPDMTMANIVSICRNTDMVVLKQAMEEFNIHYPTVDEAMECITYSTKLYWRNEKATAEIRSLIAGLDPVERAAVVYVSDLFHLAKHNPTLVRNMLVELSTKQHYEVADPDGVIKAMDDDLKCCVSLLCTKELLGKTIKMCKETDPEGYKTIAATADNVVKVLARYSLLIRALWVTGNIPPSLAVIPNIVRRTAIVSDTDSTIFTVQYWTEWVVGKLDFSEESKGIATVVVYLSSQLVTHVLAMLSANMGIVPRYIHKLAMKNEYFFDIFSLTSRAKHYWAYQSAKEGNVFKKKKLEKKGVELRDSNVPPEVMAELDKTICFIMDSIIKTGTVSILEVFAIISRIENNIKDSVLAGRYDYLTTGQIKSIDSYKNPNNATYQHYSMWEEVFAEKYGHTEPPTYSCVKASLAINNPTELKEWIANMEDRVIADRMTAWLKKNNKTGITMLLLPESVVASSGIPKEVISGMDIRRLVFSVTRSFYLLLESLGIFMIDDNLTRLISDFATPEACLAATQ